MKVQNEFDTKNLQKMDRQKAPRFLTLLCILSFIGGGLSIRSDVKHLFYDSDIDTDEVAFNLNIEGEGDMQSFIQRASENVIDFWIEKQNQPKILTISTMLLALISIVGALLMYRLNKMGFLVYTLSNLMIILISYIYYFNNTVGQMLIAFQFFFTAMFIFMYATQLKYMMAKITE